MTHADVEKYMAGYLEGDLDLDRRALFDAHLDQCEDCKREIDEMRATIALLRSLPDPEVPANLTPDVMRRIRMGEGQNGWLENLLDGFASLLEPRVLGPVSAAMLVTGLLLGTGQLQITFRGHTIPGTVNAPVAEAPSAARGSLAANGPGGAEQRPIGAFAIEDGADGRRGGSLVSGGRRSQSVRRPVGILDPPSLAEFFASRRSPDARSSAGFGRGAIRPLRDRNDYADSTPVAVASGAPAESTRALPTADEWLGLIQDNPVAFANSLAALTLAEQELWVGALGRRAMARGTLDDLVALLRASGSERAALLAEDFAATAARAGDSAGMGRSKEADPQLFE